MSLDARRLFDELVRKGTAPARKRLAVAELISAGLAVKAKSGIELTLAGQFAARQSI